MTLSGELVLLPKSIYFICSDSCIKYEKRGWKYLHSHKDDQLVIVRELNASFQRHIKTALFTEESAYCISATRFYDFAGSTEEEHKLYSKYNKLAINEHKKTGAINGFEVLNLRTLDMLWISHYDMDLLRDKVTNQR